MSDSNWQQVPNRGRGRGRARGRGGQGGQSQRGGRDASQASTHSDTASIQSATRGGGNTYRARGPAPTSNQGYNRGSVRGQGRDTQGGAPQAFAHDQPAIVDERLKTFDSLISTLQRLRIHNPEAPIITRPGFGTLGTPITLRANFFAVKVPQGVIYDYSVTIQPPVDNTKGKSKGKGKGKGKGSQSAEGKEEVKLSADLKARIFAHLESTEEFKPYREHITHDKSQRLVSSQELPQPLELSVQMREGAGDETKTTVYNVSVQFQGNLDTSQLTAYLAGHPGETPYDPSLTLSAFNLVLQDHAARGGVRVGNSRFFFRSLGTVDLGQGVEGWKGFFLSARPVYKALMVNINFCMAAFYTEGHLADKLREFQSRTSGGMPSNFMKRLKVFTTHRGYHTRPQEVDYIHSKTARTYEFDLEGRQVTVQQFFLERYRINLQYPDLPVIVIKSKNDSKENSKEICYPPELCFIAPGQAYHADLTTNQTKSMIKHAARRPAVNANSIVSEGFDKLGFRPDNKTAALQGFGVEVNAGMTVIPGRILTPPEVRYKQGLQPQQGPVQNASWNFKKLQFHAGASIGKWAVLLVLGGGDSDFEGRSDPQLGPFLRNFVNICRSAGMNMPSVPVAVLETRPLVAAVRGVLKPCIQSSRPELVIVLLPRYDQALYSDIKRLCDVGLGVHSAHMISETARDFKKQTQCFANISLKLNVKFGGINHLLNPSAMKWLTDEKTMLVGMDVTHPGPTSRKGTPSIVAIVASIDDQFVQFPAVLMIQKPDAKKESKEAIENITEAMKGSLLAYKRKNNSFPDRVIVYRDGVSEGQFEMVVRTELPQIKAAFQQIQSDGKYNPKLTIAICGKRHHTRFYATEANHVDSRTGNTLPGTVVDQGVTHPYDFDFYLQPHAALQGTVRPTHFTVVHDENNFTANTFQQGTHTISYLYGRATKAVSLPPPAYYADMAAERGRCYLHSLLNTGVQQQKLKGKQKADAEAKKQQVFDEAVKAWGAGVHSNLRGSMFYL